MKNQSATIQLLVLDEGATLSECTGITEYVDHAFDVIPLIWKTPKE